MSLEVNTWFPVIYFHLDLHELQRNQVFYANDVGSTCATITKICYAKVTKLPSDA
jgi:hypothetical protein